MLDTRVSRWRRLLVLWNDTVQNCGGMPMQTNTSGSTAAINALDGCRRVPIERAHSLPPGIFYERYLSGIGKPVIVTDELNTWQAPSKWSLDFFRSRFGSDSVIATVWPGNKYLKMMKLEDYIGYVQSPKDRTKGIWIDPKTKFPRPEPSEPLPGPLYLYGWRAFD